MFFSKNMSDGEAERIALQKRHEEARHIIALNLRPLCAENSSSYTPGYWAACHGKVEILQLIHDVILSFSQPPEKEQQLLRYVFEERKNNIQTPAHVAAWEGHITCLEFLITHCPSGPVILEAKDNEGSTPAHQAAIRNRVSTLEFILRNAPSGIGVLRMENNSGKTPLDLLRRKDHFTPQKIREIGLERELRLFDERGNSGSFVSLVFEIIKENIRLKTPEARNDL